MSGTFAGFSEEDIKNINSAKTEAKIEAKPKSRRQLSTIRRVMKPKSETDGEIHPISDDAKLGRKEDNYVPVAPDAVSIKTEEGAVKINEDARKTNEGTAKNETNEDRIKSTLQPIIFDMEKIEKKCIDLDEFQARQKLIEEQNRRRKELLGKALADRTKQTEEEARRLKEIQNEFKKLDALLSNDVAILRHQIEIASVDFMEAQKRYHKIEKDFLDAKLNLHQKLEKKEMLTEHLCAIIEKNEERKAEKLNELMARLTIGGKPICETIENENNKKQQLSDNEIIYGVKAEISSDKPESNILINK